MKNSSAAVVTGVQTPTRLTGPTSDTGWGPEVIDLAAHYGIGLDPWQKLVVTEWLYTDERDPEFERWLTTTSALTVPRQQGKSYIVRAIELGALLLPMGLNNILHTAQLAKTADRAFADIYGTFMEHTDLRRLVVRKSESHARSYLSVKGFDGELRRADFVSRTPESGRGLTEDLLIYDEAQSIGERDHNSLQFTVSARPRHKTIFLGTVPTPGAIEGQIFSRMRERSFNPETNVKWIEWGADVDDDLDDELTIAKANPAYNTRLTAETVEEERDNMSDAGFAMERCGQWVPTATPEVIPRAYWNEREVDVNNHRAEVTGSRVLALDVNHDRTMATVMVGGTNDDGDVLLAVNEQFSNPEAAVKHIARLCSKNDIKAVIIDAKSQAGTLTEQFKKAGIKVTITGEKEMATACGQLFDGVMEGWVLHIGQPQLTNALMQARKRPLMGGQAFGWNRANDTADITPLVGASLALWGVLAQKVRTPLKPKSSRRLITLA